MQKPLRFSIVIPCFNEPYNICLVMDQFQNLLRESEHWIEIIVVDGCSTDQTPEILKRKFETLDSQKFKLFLMPQRKGYGHDIVYGLLKARGDVLGWTHADMQTDPHDVLKAIEIYKMSSVDKKIIKGERVKRKFLDLFFTFGMQLVTFFLLKIYLKDINAQPKIFSREFMEKHIKNKAPDDFSLDLFVLFQGKKQGYKILSFPVCFRDRQYDEAKGGGGSWKNRMHLIERTFRYIIKLRNREKDD